MRDAFLKGTQQHRESIKAEIKRREDVIKAIERKKIEKEEFRQKRREAREARRKQQELQKLKDQIKATFVDKGETREHILQQDLLDITGLYEKAKPFSGSVGGHVLQLTIAVQALNKFAYHHLQGDNAHPPAKKHLKDILVNPGYLNFILNYLKDLKNDNFFLQIS